MGAPYDPDDDPDGFDDFPSTHFEDDEDYERYLASEFDSGGGLRDEPPVALWISIGVIALVVLALWFFL